VTIHPSYLLRIREKADAEREYERFVEDLTQAKARAEKR
jgi:DNA polymerase